MAGFFNLLAPPLNYQNLRLIDNDINKMFNKLKVIKSSKFLNGSIEQLIRVYLL
jgi:hypothetical protein